MASQPPPSPPANEQIELQKRLHEQGIQTAQRAHDRSNEFARQINEAAINAANLTLRMALLINGGAAVSVRRAGGPKSDQARSA